MSDFLSPEMAVMLAQNVIASKQANDEPTGDMAKSKTMEGVTVKAKMKPKPQKQAKFDFKKVLPYVAAGLLVIAVILISIKTAKK